MDKDTLLRLKNNPHYKLSPKQLKELRELEENTNFEFGSPNMHNGDFEKHDTTIKKTKRTKL